MSAPPADGPLGQLVTNHGLLGAALVDGESVLLGQHFLRGLDAATSRAALALADRVLATTGDLLTLDATFFYDLDGRWLGYAPLRWAGDPALLVVVAPPAVQPTPCLSEAVTFLENPA